jgi:hypothetical protein
LKKVEKKWSDFGVDFGVFLGVDFWVILGVEKWWFLGCEKGSKFVGVKFQKS